MDKVIIIDGIDVSGCEFYSATGQCKIQQVFQRNEIVGIIEKPYGVHLECNLCNKDCYYKQLKRKEQECEKLKWLLETKCQSEWEKENAELKAENEKLKIDIGIYKGIIDSDKEENERLKSIVESNNQQVEQAELLVMDNDRLQQEVENLKDTIYYDVEKYRQVLQEIREIVSEQCQQCFVVDGFTKPDDCGICDYKRILDKINSVIGAEE